MKYLWKVESASAIDEFLIIDENDFDDLYDSKTDSFTLFEEKLCRGRVYIYSEGSPNFSLEEVNYRKVKVLKTIFPVRFINTSTMQETSPQKYPYHRLIWSSLLHGDNYSRNAEFVQRIVELFIEYGQPINEIVRALKRSLGKINGEFAQLLYNQNNTIQLGEGKKIVKSDVKLTDSFYQTALISQPLSVPSELMNSTFPETEHIEIKQSSNKVCWYIGESDERKQYVLSEFQETMRKKGISETILEYYVLFREISADIMEPLILLEDFSLSNLAAALHLTLCLSEQIRSPEIISYDRIMPNHYHFAVDLMSEERTIRALQSFEERLKAYFEFYAHIGENNTVALERKTVTIDIRLVPSRIYNAIAYERSGHSCVFPHITEETVDYFTSASDNGYFFEYSKEQADNMKRIVKSLPPKSILDLERAVALSLGIVSFDPERDFARMFLYPTREDLNAFLRGRIISKSAVDRLTRKISTGRLGEEDISFLIKSGVQRKIINDFKDNVTYIPSRLLPALVAAAIYKKQLQKNAFDDLADFCPISDEAGIEEKEAEILERISDTKEGLLALEDYLQMYDGSYQAAERAEEIRELLKGREDAGSIKEYGLFPRMMIADIVCGILSENHEFGTECLPAPAAELLAAHIEESAAVICGMCYSNAGNDLKQSICSVAACLVKRYIPAERVVFVNSDVAIDDNEDLICSVVEKPTQQDVRILKKARYIVVPDTDDRLQGRRYYPCNFLRCGSHFFQITGSEYTGEDLHSVLENVWKMNHGMEDLSTEEAIEYLKDFWERNDIPDCGEGYLVLEITDADDYFRWSVIRGREQINGGSTGDENTH